MVYMVPLTQLVALMSCVLGCYIWWPLTQLVALMSCVLGCYIWWPLTQLVTLMSCVLGCYVWWPLNSTVRSFSWIFPRVDLDTPTLLGHTHFTITAKFKPSISKLLNIVTVNCLCDIYEGSLLLVNCSAIVTNTIQIWLCVYRHGNLFDQF